jgi:SAM-dependent methyltransferase
MPGSFVVFDSLVEQLIRQIAPQTALDIGCGAGKYGQFLRRLAPDCQRCGVEVEPSYIEKVGLRELYHELHIGAAADWQSLAIDKHYDLTILGSCLAQMPKSAGLDLLNFLTYRSAYTLVIAPEFVLQGVVDGVISEAHVSVWSERDLAWHDLWAWDNCRSVSVFLLRGYLPAPVSLSQLVEGINAAALPVHEFHDRQTLVRPARLRMVNHWRETVYRPA